MLHGVGKLHLSQFLELWSAVAPLIKCSEDPTFCEKVIVQTLTKVLSIFLHHLQFIPTSYCTMQQNIWELQHIYFELMCFLEFEEKYWHKTHAIKSNCNLMGASTTNMLVAHALFMVRVLVWLICPSAELLSICVCQLVVITSPQGMGIQLEPSVFPTYPAIFCGHGDCMEKYQAINDHVTGCLRFPNPFGTTCALSTVVSPPSENPTKCELSSKRYSPCEL